MHQAQGALTGWVVGVTADRRHEELIDLLRRRLARVIHAPTMRIRPLGSDDELGEAIEATIAQRPELIVLSTVIGVRGWLEAARLPGRWGTARRCGYAWLGNERSTGRDAASASDPEPVREGELGMTAPVLVGQVSVR